LHRHHGSHFPGRIIRTGLLCELVEELPSTSYTDSRGRSKTVRYWRMSVESGRLAFLAEVDEARWTTPAEAAGLLNADLAAGSKEGYTIRYTITPAASSLPEDEANRAETFSLASSPKEYGKTGRRSFFLDSSGILRGVDKQGGVATSTDPRIGPS